MKNVAKRITAGVAIAGITVLVLGAGGYAAGARINTTKSIPVGLYWTSSAPVEKGAYVLFCLGVRRKRAYSMTPRKGITSGPGSAQADTAT